MTETHVKRLLFTEKDVIGLQHFRSPRNSTSLVLHGLRKQAEIRGATQTEKAGWDWGFLQGMGKEQKPETTQLV